MSRLEKSKKSYVCGQASDRGLELVHSVWVSLEQPLKVSMGMGRTTPCTDGLGITSILVIAGVDVDIRLHVRFSLLSSLGPGPLAIKWLDSTSKSFCKAPAVDEQNGGRWVTNLPHRTGQVCC